MKKVTLFTVATMMMFMFAFTSVGFAGITDNLSDKIHKEFCKVWPDHKKCQKKTCPICKSLEHPKCTTKEDREASLCKRNPEHRLCTKKEDREAAFCKRNPKAFFCKKSR